MRFLKRLYNSMAFLIFYLFNLVKSNLIIAADILSPRLSNDPAMIKAPIVLESSFALLLFSNLLSMTPGTLSYEISADQKTITVHFLYRKSQEQMLAEISVIQRRLKRIFN